MVTSMSFLKKRIKILSLLWLTPAFIFISSCRKESRYPGYTETPTGLYYKLLAFGDNNHRPKSGDYLDVHICYRNSKDSVFLDSGWDNDLNRLILPLKGSSFLGSFE